MTIKRYIFFPDQQRYFFAGSTAAIHDHDWGLTVASVLFTCPVIASHPNTGSTRTSTPCGTSPDNRVTYRARVDGA
ncbi:MAG: hypothetical protein JXC33_02495 [Deltaproteobacteria bacterium]|nr:hypothetical protein [Deltaproteobacteria bacterium]